MTRIDIKKLSKYTVSLVLLPCGTYEVMVIDRDGEEMVPSLRTSNEATARHEFSAMVDLFSAPAASYWAQSAGESVCRAVRAGRYQR